MPYNNNTNSLVGGHIDMFASDNAGVILRLVLYRGEVYRLPEAWRNIRVRSGLAWVTFAGQDTVLACGEEAGFGRGKDSAVVSGLGHAPLVLEILGEERRGSYAVLGSAVNPAWGIDRQPCI
jgi:hypothetical protein